MGDCLHAIHFSTAAQLVLSAPEESLTDAGCLPVDASMMLAITRRSFLNWWDVCSCLSMIHASCPAGNAFAWQLVLGVTDLILHSTYDPQGKKSPIQVQQEQYERIMVSWLANHAGTGAA